MNRSLAVTQTVILAAGHGSRLGVSTGLPKPLVPVGGVALLAHALEHARASGCSSAVVVVGHEGQRVRSAVERMRTGLDVRFVENPNSSEPNGVSLMLAEPMAERVFYLQMADHFFGGAALGKLAAAPFSEGETARLLVDFAPVGIDLADATKVQVVGDRISKIGKGLEEWDAIDTGCFVLTHDIFEALRTAPASEARTVSSGMRELAGRGALGAVSIAGVPWIDIDTPADLEAADRLVSRSLSAIVPGH